MSYLTELLAEPGTNGNEAHAASSVPKAATLTTEETAVPAVEPEPAETMVEPQPAALPYLAFKVCGISFALRRECVEATMPCPDELAVGEKVHLRVIGHIEHQRKIYSVANIAALVVPENRRPAGVAAIAHGRCLVLLAGAPYGLICDAAPTEILIDADQIHWRRAQGRRTWLAGTAPAQSCALLDADTIIHLLSDPPADG